MIYLALPWILLLLIALIIVLFIRKKWLFGIVLLIIAVVLNILVECIPLRLWSVNDICSSRCFKVMSFNIQGTGTDFGKKASGLACMIEQYEPDILFVSELNDKNRQSFDSLLMKSLPYSIYSKGQAHSFYSKYKLTGWEKLEKDGLEQLGAYTCSITLGTETIIFYGCHFASNNYTSNQLYVTPDSIRNQEHLKTYISDIKRAYSHRAEEANVIKDTVSKVNQPVILMGDLNDVGGSDAVRSLERAGLTDAWWRGGFGYGATIHRPLPYRIDHIMYSDGLKLLKIKVVDSEGLSDHDALYAEFELNNWM